MGVRLGTSHPGLAETRVGIPGAEDVRLVVPAAPRSPEMSLLFAAVPLRSTASPERDGAFRLLRTRLNEIRQCCKAHETRTAALSVWHTQGLAAGVPLARQSYFIILPPRA